MRFYCGDRSPGNGYVNINLKELDQVYWAFWVSQFSKELSADVSKASSDSLTCILTKGVIPARKFTGPILPFRLGKGKYLRKVTFHCPFTLKSPYYDFKDFFERYKSFKNCYKFGVFVNLMISALRPDYDHNKPKTVDNVYITPFGVISGISEMVYEVEDSDVDGLVACCVNSPIFKAFDASEETLTKHVKDNVGPKGAVASSGMSREQLMAIIDNAVAGVGAVPTTSTSESPDSNDSSADVSPSSSSQDSSHRFESAVWLAGMQNWEADKLALDKINFQGKSKFHLKERDDQIRERQGLASNSGMLAISDDED